MRLEDGNRKWRMNTIKTYICQKTRTKGREKEQREGNMEETSRQPREEFWFGLVWFFVSSDFRVIGKTAGWDVTQWR